MFRITQIIRNSFIRLEGLIYQLFGVFRKLFSQLGFLSKLLGFTESKDLIEPEQTRSVKLGEEEAVTAQSAPAASRRRPDGKMDYYLKLAQNSKTSSKRP